MSLSYTLSHALTISNAHKNAHSQNIKTRQKNVPFKSIEEQLVVGAFHVVERHWVPIRAGGTRSLLAKCRNRIQSCGTLRGKPHGNERHDRKQQCDRREDCWIVWSHTEQKS
jgi:hypothetical protein